MVYLAVPTAKYTAHHLIHCPTNSLAYWPLPNVPPSVLTSAKHTAQHTDQCPTYSLVYWPLPNILPSVLPHCLLSNMLLYCPLPSILPLCLTYRPLPKILTMASLPNLLTTTSLTVVFPTYRGRAIHTSADDFRKSCTRTLRFKLHREL